MQVMRSALIALAACGLATLAAVPFRGVLLDANLALYYMLIVVWLTVKVGRGAGFAGAMLSVLFFDVFLVPPYGSLTVHNPQHILTFAMLLVVSLVTSRLVDGLRAQTALARERERQSESLRAMGDALLSAESAHDVRRIGEQAVAATVGARAHIVPPEPAPDGAGLAHADPGLTVGMRKIIGAMLRQHPGAAQGPVSSGGVTYFPLQAGERASGVMLLVLPGRMAHLPAAQERWVRAASVQLALALDRVHSTETAARARLAEKTARFRNSILSSISHDIRTPLTAVTGLAERLAQGQGGADTAQQLYRAALRMNGTVTNLLDIARYSQDGIAINRDWAAIDEVIGSAIQLQRPAAAPAPAFVAEVKGEPVLARFDALLVEKVLCNLIANAVLHATGATTVIIRARVRGGVLVATVADNGCGLALRAPAGTGDAGAAGDRDGRAGRDALASRGGQIDHGGQGIPGIRRGDRDHGGLGLAICRAICDAHGGRLRLFSRPGQGCCAALLIPVTDTMPLDDGGENHDGH